LQVCVDGVTVFFQCQVFLMSMEEWGTMEIEVHIEGDGVAAACCAQLHILNGCSAQAWGCVAQQADGGSAGWDLSLDGCALGWPSNSEACGGVGAGGGANHPPAFRTRDFGS
jgi:hypothetical protein